MTNVQTLAKNIISSKEVEVTVNVEDAKADELATWLHEVLNVQSSQSYTGDDNYIDLSFNNNKKHSM